MQPRTNQHTVELSILITNWNAWPDINRCLRSVGASDYSGYEVTVIDNASTDNSVENIRYYYPQVNLHVNASNIGAAPAFNQGCRLLRGQYILVLDPDTEVAPDMISTLMAFMKRRPDVALVAPRTYNTDGTIQESARNFPTLSSGIFGRQSLLTRWFPSNPFSRRYLRRDKQDAHEPFEVEQVSAACMLFHRSLIEEVGSWDEGYPAGRDDWVDTDWCMQLRKMGKIIYCVPTVSVVHHDNNQRGKKKSLYRIWAFHWGAYRLYRRHYTFGAIDPRALLALVALSIRAGLFMIGNSFLPAPRKTCSLAETDGKRM